LGANNLRPIRCLHHSLVHRHLSYVARSGIRAFSRPAATGKITYSDHRPTRLVPARTAPMSYAGIAWTIHDQPQELSSWAHGQTRSGTAVSRPLRLRSDSFHASRRIRLWQGHPRKI